MSLIRTNESPTWLRRYGFEDGHTDWTQNPDMVNICKNEFFFINYKNTIDCISSLQVVHNGIIINELFQNQYNRHSFVFNQVKSYGQKKIKQTPILLGKMFNHITPLYVMFTFLIGNYINKQ
jgi:hypothetical protein